MLASIFFESLFVRNFVPCCQQETKMGVTVFRSFQKFPANLYLLHSFIRILRSFLRIPDLFIRISEFICPSSDFIYVPCLFALRICLFYTYLHSEFVSFPFSSLPFLSSDTLLESSISRNCQKNIILLLGKSGRRWSIRGYRAMEKLLERTFS